MKELKEKTAQQIHYENNKEYYKQYYKEYNQRHKDKVREQKKKYYAENREKILNYSLSYIQAHHEKRLFQSAKTRAKHNGLEFSIKLSDVIVPEVCPYLGIPLTSIFGQGRTASNPSLDRIDNSKGYIPGNVEVISAKANVMKSSASKEELITFANNILKRYA